MKHKIHRRYFISYFADACRYVGAADDSEKEVKTRRDQENRAMYVRSAVLHCALALEAAANACLDVLDLQKGAHEDFDKLQTLGKFDVFLAHIAPGKRIDREHKLVRPIRNLVSCRNTYVHSKVLTEEIEGQRIVLKTWEPLGLPKNQSHWQPVHAVKVFTVTADFLNHFFFELCPFKYDNPQHRGNVASILGSVVFREDGGELCDGVQAAPIRDEEIWSVSDVEQKYDIQCGFTVSVLKFTPYPSGADRASSPGCPDPVLLHHPVGSIAPTSNSSKSISRASSGLASSSSSAKASRFC